jgi:hypothetical protein
MLSIVILIFTFFYHKFMFSFKKLGSTFIFISVFFVLSSQTVVKGRILDAKTKAPLPYCTIYFAGKKIGVKSDNYGNFTIRSPKEETVVFISYLGYETKEVKIYGSDFKTDILLAEKSRKKQTVDIKGSRKMVKDTLAIRIIRNVIKNKDKNKPSALESVQYDKYSKFELSVANIDSLIGSNFLTKPIEYLLKYQSVTPDGERYSPILLRETSAKVFQKGKKTHTEVIGVNDTKLFDNESIYALVEQSFEDYNVYDNQLIIANKSLAGPAATSALLFYRYYVDDSFELEGVKNYQMSFAPISKEDFGFTGKFVVEEGSWAIKDIQMYLDKRANINWVNHFAIAQSFKKVEGKWLRNRDEKDVALAISKSKKRIKVRFRQTDIQSNHIVNQLISDDMFQGDEVIRLQGYNKRSDSFWIASRGEKLSDFEAGIYKRTDTFRRSRQYKTLYYFGRVGTTAFFPIPPANWEIGRAYKFVSWNEYEGTRLRLGARMVFDSFKRFNIGGHIAYGTEDGLLKYGFESFFNLPSKNLLFHQLTVSVMHDYQRMGDAESILDFDNIIMSVFRKPGNRIRDIVLKDQIRINWVKEWKRGEETQLGIENTSFFSNSFFKFDEIMADGSIAPRDKLNTFRINASYRFAMKEPVFRNPFKRIRLKSIRPIFEVGSSIGLKGFLNSDYSFLKMRATARQQVPYVFGQFRYNLTAGKIFGRVPYIDIEQFGGNNGLIKDVNRFFLMNETEYSADMFAQLFMSQHFQGYFFNKIPLLKKLGWRENVYFRAAVGSIEDNNRNYFRIPNQMSAPESIYMETGFGISNVFKFFEIHSIWRLTQHDKPTTRKWGMLIGAFFEL